MGKEIFTIFTLNTLFENSLYTWLNIWASSLRFDVICKHGMTTCLKDKFLLINVCDTFILLSQTQELYT